MAQVTAGPEDLSESRRQGTGHMTADGGGTCLSRGPSGRGAGGLRGLRTWRSGMRRAGRALTRVTETASGRIKKQQQRGWRLRRRLQTCRDTQHVQESGGRRGRGSRPLWSPDQAWQRCRGAAGAGPGTHLCTGREANRGPVRAVFQTSRSHSLKKTLKSF